MKKNAILIGLVVAAVAAVAFVPKEIKDALGLITEMHSKYHGKVNRSVTFIQIDKMYKPDGSYTVTTSYEAFQFPGKMRIDYGPKHSINGFICSDDTIYTFEDGVLKNKTFGINKILMLTGDVFFMSPQASIERIQKSGFNTAKFHTEDFLGKPCYVVGAEKGDLKSPQFWVEKENLYLMRMIDVNEVNGELEDMHFKEHEIVGKTWIESEVQVYVNNKLVRTERYNEVNPDMNIDPKVFDHKHWGMAHWRNK